MTPDDGAPPRLVDAVETRSFDQMTAALREEAAEEPPAPSTGPVKRETQVIAIYGKGGIGKS
ncbi:MAG: hypothetical protein AAFR52_12290, partial [Pseudomonadota bacterium]